MSARSNSVILLTRSDVRQLAAPADYYAAIAASFRAHQKGLVNLPLPVEIAASGGALHGKGAGLMIGGRHYAALKVNSNFPANPARFNLPTIQGALLLFDAENGALLSIMDSIEITLLRTAAASAVAIDALALRDASSLLICGCGAQAFAHAEAILPLRPFKSVALYDSNPQMATRLAGMISNSVRCPVEKVADLKKTARDTSVVLTLTPSRQPFLDASDVSPGVIIAAVGADNQHKNEITPALIKASSVFADVADQSVSMGDMRAAIASGVVDRNHIRAELGEVLEGRHPGRTKDDEVIIFDSTGAAFQDLAAAVMLYERAQKTGAGNQVKFGD